MKYTKCKSQEIHMASDNLIFHILNNENENEK